MMEKSSGAAIRAAATTLVNDRLEVVEVFSELPSTNSYLLTQTAPAPGMCRLAIAEHQNAGRGQRGKVWESPGRSGLTLSVAYTFSKKPQYFSSLTLAVGISIATALNELGAGPVSLKWPNDIIAADGKLGGILTEVRPGSGDEASVVTGIGLNLDTQGVLDCIDVGVGRVTDLQQVMAVPPERLALTTTIIDCLVRSLIHFEEDGFEPFLSQWPQYDWLKGKAVHIEVPKGFIDGIARGVDKSGALRVDTGNAIECIISGTVTLSARI